MISKINQEERSFNSAHIIRMDVIPYLKANKPQYHTRYIEKITVSKAMDIGI